MKPRLFSIRLGAVVGLAWLLAQSSTQASDVRGFRVLKGQNFVQTSTGAATANGVSNFVMQCQADFQPAGALTNLTFTKPDMQVLSAFPDGDTQYGFEQSFSSQSALDTEFPSGTYTVTMKTLNDGTKAVPLPLTGDTYPNTPHISNFTAAQAVVPSLDFTLTWDSLGGTVNDFVFLNIRDGGGQEVFSGPEMGQPGALDGTSTSLLIPARKLRPGQVYQVELFIAQASQPPDQASYPGATGIAAYFKQLKFNLITTGTQTGPTAGNFSLIFNFYQGVFDGTNGSISFPRYLGYYYALYNIDNDVNYPPSVVFTGPGGSGLTNVTSQVNGSSFGNSAFYSSPQVNFSPANLPQGAIYSSTQPSGGIYTVNYKTSNYQFNLLDPRSADQQILVVPTVVLTATNTIQEIRWTYKNTNGTTVGAQAFMENIQIRVNGISGGRLYDGGNENGRILPTVTSHTVTSSVAWTNVSSIQMLFEDTVGNQYVSYWDRAVQPVEITTTGLPNALQGTPFNFLLSSQGGTQPVSWSLISGYLPSGLSLNANTGEILGTPGENGSFPLTFQAVDSANAVTNRSLFLFVAAGSFPAPVLTNAALLGNGQLKVALGAVSNQTYTLESSTNLVNWTPRVTLLATNNQIDLVDPDALGSFPRLFYRMRIGRTFGTTFNFHFYAQAGNFGAGLTPAPGFPIALNSYTANFETENSRTNPPPTSVLFTGPGGSGLSSSPADAQNSSAARFQSAFVNNPVGPSGGTWTVNYHGSNLTFTVPAPQVASRLVIPVPTATLSGGNLTGVSWVYQDAATGAPLGQPPGHMTDVQVQVDVQGQGRVYNSPNLPPGTTSVSGINGVVWNDVVNLFMVYNDTLGNHYVVSFSKP